jgi:hypothetical protein
MPLELQWRSRHASRALWLLRPGPRVGRWLGASMAPALITAVSSHPASVDVMIDKCDSIICRPMMQSNISSTHRQQFCCATRVHGSALEALERMLSRVWLNHGHSVKLSSSLNRDFTREWHFPPQTFKLPASFRVASSGDCHFYAGGHVIHVHTLPRTQHVRGTKSRESVQN